MMVYGLLLAAGRGRRFDPAGQRSKLEARIADEPVALHALRSLATGCNQVIAVCRKEQVALAQSLEAAGARIVFLDSALLSRTGEGMGVSLAAGAGALAALSPAPDPDRDQILVLPADMPWIRPQTVRAIVSADAAAPIVVPIFLAQAGAGPTLPIEPVSTAVAVAGAGAQHHRDEGHPVRFAARLLGELASLGGDRGARVLFSRHAVLRLAVSDPGIIEDVDTPADLGRHDIRP